jgi:hypothetical protein
MKAHYSLIFVPGKTASLNVFVAAVSTEALTL